VIKISKRYVVPFIIMILCAMILVPIFINLLMMFNTPITTGDSSVWIGSLSNFWGAIIGGVISGVITLLGVIMTIQSNFKSLEKNKELEFRKEQLIRLYQPCYAQIIKYKANHGKHTFYDLNEKEQIDYVDLLLNNQIYGSSELRGLIEVLVSNYQMFVNTPINMTVDRVNDSYSMTNEVIIKEMSAILKTFSSEVEFYEKK